MASLSAYDRISMMEARLLRAEHVIRLQSALIGKLEARVAMLMPAMPHGTPRRIPDNPPPKLGRMIEIASSVAARHMVSLAALRGPSRQRAIAWPRQEAMRDLMDAGYSTTQIGRFLGNRDHTTVIHGARAARARGEHR